MNPRTARRNHWTSRSALELVCRKAGTVSWLMGNLNANPNLPSGVCAALRINFVAAQAPTGQMTRRRPRPTGECW